MSENYLLDLIKKIPEILEEKKVVFFLINALGLNKFNLPFLKKFVYRTVFPSSTPNFLYSFHSLLNPKEHGFLEWFMRFGELKKPIQIPPWETLKGRPLKVKRRKVFPFKSLSEILHKKGFSSCYYTPFANTLFVQATSRKADVKNIQYLSEVFPLREADFTYIYWPSTDYILHHNFISETFVVDLKFLELFIKILYKKLHPNSKLIVLSDHGQTKVRKSFKLPLIKDYPVGGGRVGFYKGEKEIIEKEIRRRKIPAFIYELKDLEFFAGKISKRCYKNFGNILLIAKDHVAFNYPFAKTFSKFVGRHGGLSKEEIFVNVWVGEK